MVSGFDIALGTEQTAKDTEGNYYRGRERGHDGRNDRGELIGNELLHIRQD